MDRFSISDECYHELSMLCSQLPRSHKVKSLRKTMNKSLETTFLRVPHPYQGVYCSFRTKLQEEINVVVSFAYTLRVSMISGHNYFMAL